VTTSNSADTARAWADIDLAAIVSNARSIAEASGTRLLPMVKADGYGLGAVPVVAALESVEPFGYGVATLPEARELRAAGIDRPVIAFTPLLPARVESFLEHDIRPVIADLTALEAWTARTPRPFHVEVDTGMGRAGFRWDDAESIGALGTRLAGCGGWEGLFTHFHSADDVPGTLPLQARRFAEVVAAMPSRPPILHMANSAASLRDRAYAADMVRPGIYLYGGGAGGRAPRAALRVSARVVAVRTVQPGDTVSYGARWRAPTAGQVATLAIGYADGMPRGLENRGLARLGSGLYRMAGAVTMDMTMVFLGDAVTAPGEVATLIGDDLTVDRQARLAGTISYELLTALGSRVVRRYGGMP
jgi:alanine racemase